MVYMFVIPVLGKKKQVPETHQANIRSYLTDVVLWPPRACTRTDLNMHMCVCTHTTYTNTRRWALTHRKTYTHIHTHRHPVFSLHAVTSFRVSLCLIDRGSSTKPQKHVCKPDMTYF